VHDLLVVRGACMALLNWGRRTDESGVSAWQICVPASGATREPRPPVCRSPRRQVRRPRYGFRFHLQALVIKTTFADNNKIGLVGETNVWGSDARDEQEHHEKRETRSEVCSVL